MPDVYQERLDACNKLESGETALLKTAAKIQAKKNKEAGKAADVAPSVQSEENLNSERSLTLADQLVPRDQRPTHRLPLGFLPFSLPLIGTKVDTIDWAREEIARTNTELTKMQKALAKEVASTTKSSRLFNMSLQEMARELDRQMYPPLNSAFILFNNQMAAHMASLLLTHHEPYRMSKKYIDVAPEDIVWSNLSMNPYEGHVRTLISYAATAGLVSALARRPTSPSHPNPLRLSSGHSRLHSSVLYLTSQNCAQPTVGFVGFAVFLQSLSASSAVSYLPSCFLSSWHSFPSSFGS